MKSKMKLAVAAGAALVCIGASAAEGMWTEGFGQGNLEYFIDKEGYRLYIGCPTQDGSADSFSCVTVQNLRTERDAGKFALDVAGGVSIEGPVEASSRAGNANFLVALERLRKGDAVLRVQGRVIKLPKANAAKVIPVYGKRFECNIS